MTTEIYRVKSGENLSMIAKNLLGDMERWPELAFLNNISHPYFIYPGQVLELPPEKDSNIVEIVSNVAAPVAQTTGFSNRPATVILLAIGAAILFSKKR